MTGLVALTGGTGFVGPHLAAALAAEGWRLRMLVRRPPKGGLPPGTELVEGHLGDGAALVRLVDGADALVHAAGLVKARGRDEFMAVNRDGTRNLARAVMAMRPGLRVVNLSSLAAREPRLSDYAESKQAGEQAWSEAGIANLVHLRPPAIYGPGDRETGLFLRAAFGPILPIPKVPHARICLIYAADLARAVAALCASGLTGTLEVSDSRTDGYGWRELAEQIIAAAHGTAHIVELPALVMRSFGVLGAAAPRLIGRTAMLGPGKVRELLHPDWASARDAQPPAQLWQPRMGLADGLAQTMAWLREREVLACAMN